MKVNYKVKQKSWQSLVKFCIAISCLLSIPGFVQAQDLPCGGDDPYATCPLDTWVFVLAFAAVILAVLYLKKNQDLKVVPAKVRTKKVI